MSEYIIEPNIWNSNNFFFCLSQIHRRAVIGACGIKGLKSYAYSGRGCNAEYFFQCDGNSFSVISELILLVVIAVSSSVLPQLQYTKNVVLPVVTSLYTIAGWTEYI